MGVSDDLLGNVVKTSMFEKTADEEGMKYYQVKNEEYLPIPEDILDYDEYQNSQEEEEQCASVYDPDSKSEVGENEYADEKKEKELQCRLMELQRNIKELESKNFNFVSLKKLNINLTLGLT